MFFLGVLTPVYSVLTNIIQQAQRLKTKLFCISFQKSKIFILKEDLYLPDGENRQKHLKNYVINNENFKQRYKMSIVMPCNTVLQIIMLNNGHILGRMAKDIHQYLTYNLIMTEQYVFSSNLILFSYEYILDKGFMTHFKI